MAWNKPWLLLLLQVCSQVSQAHDLTGLTAISGNCSREDSRHARNVLQQYLFKHLGDSASHLPRDCPLHPALDMFKDQELHKSKKNKDQHKCGYCGKVFKAEPYLDKHMQKKHVDRIPEGATSCLADHCDSLHCEWFKLRHLETSSRAQIRSKRAQLGTQCVPFLAALARQSCHELAAKCFPLDTPDRAMRTSHHHGLREPFEQHWDAARAFFETYFCEAVTCNLQLRDALLENVVRTSTVWSRWKGQLVVLLVLLAMFYAGLYMWWWVSQEQQQQQQQQQQQTSEDDPAGKLSRRSRSRHLVPAVGRMSMGMPTSPSRPARKQVASHHRSSPSQSRPSAGTHGSQLQESGGNLLGRSQPDPDHGLVLRSSLQTSLTQLHSRQGPPAGLQGWHAGKQELPASSGLAAPASPPSPGSSAPALTPTSVQPPGGGEAKGGSRAWAPAAHGGVLPPPPFSMPPPPPLLSRGPLPPVPPPRPGLFPGPSPPTGPSLPSLPGMLAGQLRPPPPPPPHLFPQLQVSPAVQGSMTQPPVAPLYRHTRGIASTPGTGATPAGLPPLVPQAATSAASSPLVPPAVSAGSPVQTTMGPLPNGKLGTSTGNRIRGQGGTKEVGAKSNLEPNTM